jgi:hypothetical protein
MYIDPPIPTASDADIGVLMTYVRDAMAQHFLPGSKDVASKAG